MFKIVSQAISLVSQMLFKTKAMYNCCQQVPQKCIVIEPAIILSKKLQIFVLKSSLQEAPSAKHQGKKLQQCQAKKNYHHGKKKTTSQTIIALAIFVLEFLPSCYLTNKKNILFEIPVSMSSTDFSCLFREHLL